MKIGLVLEGGAMRGLYTAGVLDVFLDKDIKVTDILGVSAGAVFGVNYKSNQRGRTRRYNLKYLNDKRYMSINSLIKTGNLVNKEFAYYTLPSKLDIFDEKAYEDNNINFYAVITNMETGKPEYEKIDNAEEKIEVLRASSSMPFLSKPVLINNNSYLDGGISDSIPVLKAIEMGCDKVIVVLTRPIEYRKKKRNSFLIKMFYKKYPNLINTMVNRYKNYNDIVEEIIKLEEEGKIFVIRPSRLVDIKRVEKDPKKLQEMYDLGVSDTISRIEELKNYLRS